MRGAKTVFAILVMGTLAACEDEPLTLRTLGPNETFGERQTLCVENQIKSEDYTLPVFERERARDDYNQADCVYRPQS